MSCFKLAQRADTSQLIISHLKHLEHARAELAFSITAEVTLCVCDGKMQLHIHSANECEAGTQGTPTAIHIQGLMNLSEGK